MATKRFQFLAVCSAIFVLSVLNLPMASVQSSEQKQTGEVKAPPVLQKPMPETLKDLQEMEAHLRKIIAQVMPAVVNAKMANGGQGSGVLVSEDGMVLNAAHVTMAPGTAFTLIFPDGKQAKGKSLGRNVTADSGLIQIVEPGKYPYCEMGNSADLKLGDWCLAISHGGGLKPGRAIPPVRLGRINGLSGKAEPDKVGWLSSDSTLVGGDSGGPLFDMQGKVIGIHAQGLDAVTSNFHVPVDTFRLEWSRLIKGEDWGKVRDKPPPPTGPASQDPDKDIATFKNDARFKAAFQSPVAKVSKSTVRIKCDGAGAALGVVLTADGYILTKACELKGRITVVVPGGQELEATWIGHHGAYDLAVLKIKAVGLQPIELIDSTTTPIGSFVSSAGTGPDPVAVGIVSAAARTVPSAKKGAKQTGNELLALKTVDDPRGAKVTGTPAVSPPKLPKGASFLPPPVVKIKTNDIIVAIDSKVIANAAALTKELQTYTLNDEVIVKLIRGDTVVEERIILLPPLAAGFNYQNQMGSDLSKRIDGFPVIMQHDSVVLPSDCGGPLVNLEGKVIGINIARAGRMESYSLPSEAIVPLLADLKSGKLPPPKRAELKKE